MEITISELSDEDSPHPTYKASKTITRNLDDEGNEKRNKNTLRAMKTTYEKSKKQTSGGEKKNAGFDPNNLLDLSFWGGEEVNKLR